MQKLFVSCIITLHREGLLAHTTLHSIARARKRAEDEGIKVQCVVTLDMHDSLTERVVKSHPLLRDDDILDIVCYGDAGLSRNHAIRRASGDYIIIIDGDDYCSDNFISVFTKEAALDTNRVLFPEYLFNFGMFTGYVKLGWPEDPQQKRYALFSGNCFCSRLAGHREVFSRIPFVQCSAGFGYEDWHWVCEAVAAGVSLCPAPDVVLFYRRQSGSRGGAHARDKTVIPPSKFFEMLPPPEKTDAAVHPVVAAPSLSRKALAKEALLTCLQFLPEKLAASIFSKLKAALVTSRSTSYPPAIEKGLWEVAAVDGMLHPSVLPPASACMPHYELLSGKAYATLWHALSSHHFDVVYIAGHVGVGGADLMAINYMRSMVDAGQRVLCILVEDAARPLGAVPEGVVVLPFGKHTKFLRHAQKQEVLVRLLLQLGPSVIHAVNEWLSFEMIGEYGNALKKQSKLYASIFADFQDEHDIHFGGGTQFLRSLMHHCTKIITDNMVTAREWHARLGVPLELFSPVYGVMHLADAPQAEGSCAQRMLWAGRLDSQKRVDILLAIARALPEVFFGVYGQAVLDGDSAVDALAQQPNVTLYGGYRSFYEIPVQEYAALVYTAQYDGLPNVLLEAAACGLPLIAPDRGGITDFVSNETGWLIASHTDVEAYARAIKAVLADPAEAAQRARRAQSIVRHRHTPQAFATALAQAYGVTSVGNGHCVSYS